VYAGFKFNPDIELKGIYYWQDQDDAFLAVTGDDSAKAWKAIVDVNQNALKFTSLWLEYGQIDNNFLRVGGSYPYGLFGTDVLLNQPWNTNTSTVWTISTAQKWSDKWRTLLRFVHADFDTAGLDDATDWTVGVAYRLNPAIEFELDYDNVDFGDNPPGYDDSDHVIRFRTVVNF
jgi:hypothetical protein